MLSLRRLAMNYVEGYHTVHVESDFVEYCLNPHTENHQTLELWTSLVHRHATYL